MFSVTSDTTVGQVGVATSDNGGLSNEQISEMAIKKIISVSESAPEPIKQQAHVFADNVRNLLHYYIELARKEERANICHQLREAGQNDLAEVIRRI
tara:strand:- start:379 stop:669 length:291 start_codon:yes stop_codon:yes gene_type:complete